MNASARALSCSACSPRRGVLLGLGEALLGLREPLAQLADVERVDLDCLGDQHPRLVREHLEPAVRPARSASSRCRRRAGEARPGRRPGEHRRVVGEDADLADAGTGRDLLDLAVVDLPLRRQDLSVERRVRHRELAPRPSGVLDDLVDRALHVEGALGQVVVLAVEDLAEPAHRLVDRHVLARRGR